MRPVKAHSLFSLALFVSHSEGAWVVGGTQANTTACLAVQRVLLSSYSMPPPAHPLHRYNHIGDPLVFLHLSLMESDRQQTPFARWQGKCD
jgi:hypothetical protein